MKAKKSLGQNFLIDNTILEKIDKEISVTKDDLIIEIGPGRGALTKYLALKESYLICYEIDKDLSIFLNKFTNNKTKIIYKDILECNIEEDIKDINYHNLYIVGNLPYYITTPIIKHLLNLNLDITKMVFMVQEEVANRFTAKVNSKDYSSITLFLKYYFNITKLFKVSKYSFNPTPKVESAVISFEKRKDRPNIKNKEIYFKLINDSFKMKRKTLKNNLSNYNYNIIKEILNKYNLDENVRGEEIEEEVFIDIANNIGGE